MLTVKLQKTISDCRVRLRLAPGFLIRGRYETRTSVVTVDQDGQEVHGHIIARSARDSAEPWARQEHAGAPSLRQETREREEWVPGSPAVAAESLLTGTAIPGLRWDDPAYWPPER